MSQRKNTLFAVACIGIAVMTRIIAKKYFKNPPSNDIPMPTESDFATAKEGKDIFFYDLGGTFCMCEWKWSVADYWSKVISGFAFNFAHVIGTFEFYILTGNTKILIIAVFVNEMIEELWLTSGYWGFTLDPPMDMEARYDSLIRDTVCCFLGIGLAHKFGKVFKVKPIVKAPVVFSFDIKNPHSITRWAKFAVEGIALWQITLIYNADLGPHKFNPGNILLLVAYASTILVICYWNIDDFPDCTRRHVITWHLGWMVFSIYLFLYTIYPSFDSAMYLIFVVECSASIAIYWIDVYFRNNVNGIQQQIFGNQQSSKQGGAGHSLLEDETRNLIPLSCYKKALDMVDNRGDEKVSMEGLKKLAADLHHNPDPSELPPSKSEYMTICFKTLIRIVIILICISQPFLWDGPQYKRHWCGNPLVMGFNGCAKYHDEL